MLFYLGLNTSNNYVLTILYFIIWIFAGNYILLNLVLAILLNGFGEVAHDDDNDENIDEFHIEKIPQYQFFGE